MNERIQELIVEATVKVNNPLVDSHGEIVCDDWEETIDLEKFAELIVRECVSTLNEMHMWQSVNNQNYPSAWHDAVDNGIETIKEHFGVE